MLLGVHVSRTTEMDQTTKEATGSRRYEIKCKHSPPAGWNVAKTAPIRCPLHVARAKNIATPARRATTSARQHPKERELLYSGAPKLRPQNWKATVATEDREKGAASRSAKCDTNPISRVRRAA